ncbi:hypothetical protein ACHAXA_000105 [Cyclostephanos tholiformis]|uniref:Chitin-binding type-4 domain-containing protein n=1 Tax=Cyclostephanos tholiformis TaxID=382380 RepID=A0ABD3RXU9_9STRA
MLKSRNEVARSQGIEWDSQSLNQKAGWETCGRSPSINYNTWSSNTIEATYTVGQQIDVEVTFTAHHKGHFVLKACPISSGGTATQACFDNNKLRFISGEGANFDQNFPERAYIPPPPPGTQASNGWHPGNLPACGPLPTEVLNTRPIPEQDYWEWATTRSIWNRVMRSLDGPMWSCKDMC